MNNRLCRHTRGQSVVEAALALPVLIILMLGLLDFGRAYYAIVSLRDAADEGASYASYRPGDVTGIRQRAAEASRQLAPIEPNDVAVIYPSALRAGAPITVTTGLTLRLYTPFASMFVPTGTLELAGTATHALVSTQ